MKILLVNPRYPSSLWDLRGVTDLIGVPLRSPFAGQVAFPRA